MTCECQCQAPRRRLRLTAPLVAASVVLFLSLGGTAYAAGTLARNSVGTPQIKAKAVSAAKIRTGAVGSSKVANNSLTGSDVADNSLTGRDLANGSVTGADLANGSIGGTKIAGNSVGLQAVERSTQDYFTNVPTSQVLPSRTDGVQLIIPLVPVLTWATPKTQVGTNLIQAQVNIRATSEITVYCEITVDGTPVTTVQQTIARTSLVYDYANLPLSTVQRLAEGAVVRVECKAGGAFRASVLTDSSNPTGMTVTRVAR